MTAYVEPEPELRTAPLHLDLPDDHLALRAAHRVGVSVLADAHERTARQLAGPAAGRFAEIDVHVTAAGAVVLLQVHGHRRGDSAEPLVFHRSRFRGLASDV